MTISRLNSDTTYLPAFRNLLINGAMQVAQRGTSTASISTEGYYTADRWSFVVGTLGTWTQSVENDAPTGSGFRKSLKVLCTTADSSPASGDVVFIRQSIEGQNLQAIKKGTANAEQLTVSFWVKANVTGTYIVNMFDSDNTRAVSASYSIASSATWEKKTIIFPADTTGAFDNDNAASLRVDFWLGAGTDFTSGTLNTSWNSNVNTNRAVGVTNLAAATNNYWQITGVQLEVGAVATPFEFKPFAQDLQECYRYAQMYNSATGNGAFFRYSVGQTESATGASTKITLPVPMRITPSVTTTGTASNYAIYHAGVATACNTVPAIGSVGSNFQNANILATAASGLTAGRGVELMSNNNQTSYLLLTAEL